MALVTEDYFHPETLARLSTFELRAKMVVEGIRSGMHRSPYRGVSVEFAEHRQYAHGDDIRHLDWKVYARSDKLHLKQFEQETNLDVVIVADSSGSMNYGTFTRSADSGETHTWTKFNHATMTAAAMAYLALTQRDRVGLAVFADGVRALVSRRSSIGHWRQIAEALNTHPVVEHTSIGRSVDQVLGKVTNRVLMVLVSDFFDDLEQIRTALARVRHRGHDLILLQILDRQEMEFNFRGTAPFEGLEDEGKVRLDPRAIRKAYLETLAGHCRGIHNLARGFGFDYERMNSHESIAPALSRLLARRISLMKKGRLR
jgi:uncharacterized protein (DUF58 family)